MLWWPLRFPHKNDVRFILTTSCLYEGSCPIHVICVWVQWYPTHIVLCFVCLRLVSCVPNVASFLGSSILDCYFGFFNVYFYLFCQYLLSKWAFYSLILVYFYLLASISHIIKNISDLIFFIYIVLFSYFIFSDNVLTSISWIINNAILDTN